MSEPPAERLLRAVLDTNVYASGTILPRGTPFQVLEAWRQQEYVLVTSPAILAEIERVLRYPRIRDRYGISEEQISRLEASLRADAVVVPGELAIDPTCFDPDDNKFLACALEVRADYLVTGDPDLLRLGQFAGTAIVTPAEFMMLLSKRQ